MLHVSFCTFVLLLAEQRLARKRKTWWTFRRYFFIFLLGEGEGGVRGAGRGGGSVFYWKSGGGFSREGGAGRVSAGKLGNFGGAKYFFSGRNVQIYPQYCWEFHDRLWEALSGTNSEKRSAPSRTGGEIILEMLWKPEMPWIIGLGASQPYSWREFQETLWERFRGLSGIFPEILPESASRTGGVAQTSAEEKSQARESSPKSKFWGRISRRHLGVLRADIPAQNFGQGARNPGKKEQAFRCGHPWPEGADVYDPRRGSKNFGQKTSGWIFVP